MLPVGARWEAREHITREFLDNRLRHIPMWPGGTGRILMIKYSRGTCIPWNVTGVFAKSRTEGIYPCNCTRICPNMYIDLYIVKLFKLANACLNVN